MVAIISMVVTVAAYFVIPRPRRNHSVTPVERPTLDYFGALLITLSLVLLIFTLSQGNTGDDGWAKPYIPSLMLVCVILFMTFVGWEWWLENKTKLEPLMRMSIWSNRGFTMSMIVTGFFWASFNNYMIYATFLYVPSSLPPPLALADRRPTATKSSSTSRRSRPHCGSSRQVWPAR